MKFSMHLNPCDAYIIGHACMNGESARGQFSMTSALTDVGFQQSEGRGNQQVYPLYLCSSLVRLLYTALSLAKAII